MVCANCGENITKRYVRAGKNCTQFCGEKCAYEAYEGYYTRKEVDKTMMEVNFNEKQTVEEYL